MSTAFLRISSLSITRDLTFHQWKPNVYQDVSHRLIVTRTQEMTSLKIVWTAILVASLFQCSSGQNDLQITSVTSPNSAQLLVTWTSTSSSVSYFTLELRVVNNSAIAPITVYSTGSARSKVVQGLRAGTTYNVTIRAYSANSAVVATTWMQSQTVPAAPQITSSSGVSSSEITVTWSSQVGANYYFLMITLGSESINHTYNALSCNVVGLQPSSLYSLTLYAVNSAGASTASKIMTVLTLTPPPTNITVTPVSSYSVILTWSSVKNALMYGIFIYEKGPQNILIVIRKTTSSSIVLDNLQPCTKYIFSLVSYNWFYTAGEEKQVLHETGILDAAQDLSIEYLSNVESAVVLWAQSSGATSYVASAKSEQGHEVQCTTSSTSCEIQGLLCEQRYVVSVIAETPSCRNNMSANVTLVTALCAPSNITVLRECEITTFSLSWNPIKGAIKYTALALSPDGTRVECSNQDTNCFFMNLRCGTEYEMSVFAFDGVDNGSSSPGIKVRTAPCDPQILTANTSCEDNSLMVTWLQSAGALYYVVSALGSSGYTYNCSSVSTSCQITGLRCGESLSVTAIAYDNKCPSSTSEGKEVATGPCAPIIISALTDCGSHSTRVQWHYSDGAISYMVHAKAKNGPEYSCESYDQSCSLLDLPCGQSFSVSVTASNYQCESSFSTPSEFQTVPCIPQNVITELTCDQNALLVTWTDDTSNVTYEATAKDNGTEHHTCTTQDTSCEISNITCGQRYSVSVRADNGQCAASSNWTAPVTSAPCQPTNVQTRSSLASGNVEISWTKSHGLGVLMYIATVLGTDGQQLMCQSTSELCIIQGPKCGQPYTAELIAVSESCHSHAIQVYMDPVPCSPMNLNIHVSPGLVVTSWADTPGAVNYTVEITGVDGEHIYQTSNTSYSVLNLVCGHEYNVTITAIGHQSSSNTSDTTWFQTAPCAPQNVATQLDVVTNIATVSWDNSLGLKNHTVVAVGPGGEQHVCYSLSASCEIIGLHCGTSYSITVKAANEWSNSEPSSQMELQTGIPCSPLNLDVHVTSGSVVLSWADALGAVSYSVEVIGVGGENHTYQTTNTTYSVMDLLCGHQYNFSIKAIGNQSSSNPTDIIKFQTAPCTPQNVTTQLDSVTNIATVSWGSSKGPQNHTVIAVGPNGEQHVCYSMNDSCEITNLICGLSYSVIVQATNEWSSSEPSPPMELQMAPCVPEQYQPQLNCVTSTAILSWGLSAGAVSYMSNLTDTEGQTLSCHTENTSCVISDLKCGQIYTITVTAINSQGSSPTSASATLTTGPCQPQDVAIQVNCTSSVAQLSWKEAQGAIGYTSTLSLSGDEYQGCNSTDIGCEIHGLQCGQTYNVTVTAFNDQCQSTRSTPTPLHTVPCVPSEVQASTSCESNLVTLSWMATFGAVNYTSVVTGPQGEQHYCQTTNTTCRFPQLACGLEYEATISAIGQACSSDISTAITFHTVPCIVANVSVLFQCGLDNAVLSWGKALGGVLYTATVSASDGKQETCNSTETSCEVVGLQCGQKYSVSVESTGAICRSIATSPDTIQTAPCVPQNVSGVVNCQTNSAALSWSVTPGAENYTALVTSPNGQELICNTTSSSCNITDLQCGLNYSVTVTGANSGCQGGSSDTIQLATAPCAPGNVLALTDCVTASVSLSWDDMAGVQGFTSYLVSSDGENRTCSSTQANCTISGLPCGQEYTVMVLPANQECNGPPSNAVTIRTAPCVPASVSSSIDCADNTANISWIQSQGAVSYSSLVTGPQGETYNCSSDSTFCHVWDLPCGQSYAVSVTAENDVCRSVKNSVTELQTGPCTPKNLSVLQSCSSNMVKLQWTASHGAVYYGSSLTPSIGNSHTCNTTDTACDIGGLQCGETYNVTVTAFNSQCAKVSQQELSFQTAPCLPTNVRVQLQCATDVGTLLWDAAQGATMYAAMVTGEDGWNSTCTSQNTTCDISGLACGHMYRVSLTASNARCNSTAPPAEIYTAPCAPQNVKAVVLCDMNITALSWDLTPGALNYTTTVTGAGGEDRSCSTGASACHIEGLECGQNYSVTVTAYGGQCSTPSNYLQFHSAPCIPDNMAVQIHCENNTATLSWDPTSGADGYISSVVGASGEDLTCNTTGTSCDVSGLQCGHTYNATVTAVNEQCRSAPSITAQLQTGPCVPQILDVTPSCSSDTVTLSWSVSSGVESFMGILSEADEKIVTCNTTDQSCDVSGLECGKSYSATVEAFNSQCSSGSSPSYMVHTAPCVPMNPRSSVACDTHSVSVSWDSAHGADIYTLTARNGENASSCVTENTFCEFNDLLCDGDYEVTIFSSSSFCNSTSSSLHVKTIPCAPLVLDAYTSCDNNSAFITWDINPNARSYMANVEGVNTSSCNTTDTVCEIRDLPCGRNYTATVWAEDGTCRGPSSLGKDFKTAPCVPQSVVPTVVCDQNALLVSWNSSSGATVYSATAVGRQGDLLTNNTQDLHCVLSTLQCGEKYSVTVVASHEECKSAESPAVEITAAPCSPLHLTAAPDCVGGAASASWEPGTGARSYLAVFRGPDGDQASCNTTDTRCAVSGLNCGQVYNVSVTAYDGLCQSLATNVTHITTAPCVPTDAMARVDCTVGIINVTWTTGRGAESYTVTATGRDGHTRVCHTDTSGCDIQDVMCGETYTVSLLAQGKDCSSAQVDVGSTETAPCVPVSVAVQLDCSTDEALVSWQDNNTVKPYYIAVTHDPSGNKLSCSSFSSSCRISGLVCGQEYIFMVYAANRQCQSNSVATKTRTAPCEPQALTIRLDCESNNANLSWLASNGSLYYVASLSGDGATLHCNTTDTSCPFPALQCGRTYNTSVVAVDNQCTSVRSATSYFESAPCQPQTITSELNCAPNAVTILWDPSDGAQLYEIDMEYDNQVIASYSTANTSVLTQVLPCGHIYGFTVMAVGGRCNSSMSATHYQKTAPCIPEYINGLSRCPTNMADVSWVPSTGASEYHLMASVDGQVEASCSSTNGSCGLLDLRCGMSYVTAVVARGQNCSSDPSPAVILDTAPCLPQNATVLMHCRNNSATFTWQSSHGALWYRAVVTQGQESVYSCHTNETVCVIPNLTCGAVYNFSVAAVSLQCESSFTEPILAGMVPCPPDKVESSIYHGSVKPQEVEILWNGSWCGADYMATVQGLILNDPESVFTQNSYWTSYLAFYIPVPCSSSYNITVTARNLAGESDPSAPIGGYNAPCAPIVKPLVISDGNMLVSWERSINTEEYRVIELNSNATVCKTTGLSCEVPLGPSPLYVIAVNPAGQSEPANIPGL
ncbi:uncharacterized protein O3C94_016554 [Discoglossus pictus]